MKWAGEKQVGGWGRGGVTSKAHDGLVSAHRMEMNWLH